MTYNHAITTQISETLPKQVLYKDVWYLKPNDFRYANNVLFEKIKVYIEGVVAHLQSFEDREFSLFLQNWTLYRNQEVSKKIS